MTTTSTFTRARTSKTGPANASRTARTAAPDDAGGDVPELGAPAAAPARTATAATATTATTRVVASPIGPLTLHAGPHGLRAIELPASRHPLRLAAPSSGSRTADRILDDAERELAAYFAGERRAFTIALEPEGTPFQRQVWDALATIPYAATWSYGQLAAAIGRPGASRAVGAANGRNPLPIIVPCHRVIGHDGSATGYGGGLPAKRWLLSHEAAVAGLTLPGL
ncbi:MAG TPA: methylated-DNA--[protein]-cysteine S-methyltransferase [Kofleriaceae bacterium]|nr:methylated-DNA--[protein]-cysteine S-methyltransferase [Kofleriaceae bacterium]